MPDLNGVPKNVVYVIDGEVADESAFRSLSPLRIKNVTVLRRDSQAAKLYGEHVTVLMVQTKEVDEELLDMLKKFPGVKMDADGRVTTNGEPVSQITVIGGTGKKVNP